MKNLGECADTSTNVRYTILYVKWSSTFADTLMIVNCSQCCSCANHTSGTKSNGGAIDSDGKSSV